MADSTDPPQPWLHVLRQGVFPQLPSKGLESLARALASDAGDLVQGTTTEPPATPWTGHDRCRAACPVAYAMWRGFALWTVSEVHGAFSRLCQGCDARTGEPGSIRHLASWVDEQPWAIVRSVLLREVNRELQRREGRRAA